MADSVAAHYGRAGIVARILAAIAAGGQETGRLTPSILYPFDQLHARELQGTSDHVEWLSPAQGEHVLDVGSGIGGPARFIAATSWARVTGIDLTPEFVDAARELTQRTGLDHLVGFEVGDALHMPFDSERFDAAICLYVAMNIADKAALAREIARVLKHGGRLLWSQAVEVEGREPAYPLPWAGTAATSSLASEAELRATLEAAGFMITGWRDETASIVEHARKIRAAGRKPTPEQVMANEVVMGERFLEARRNFIVGMEDGALKGVAVLARSL